LFALIIDLSILYLYRDSEQIEEFLICYELLYDMHKLIEIKTQSGTLLVEGVDILDSYAEQEGTRLAGGDKIKKKLNEMLSNLTDFCESILQSITNIKTQPNSTTIEFGLSFSAEGNLYVVKAAGEASIKITMNWDQKVSTKPTN
jgi:hypothetical protein